KSFLMTLSENEVDKISLSRKLSAVRGLFKYAYRNEFISSNPASAISNPKTVKKLPSIASEESILGTYEKIEKAESEKSALLIKTIFEFLYGSALRVSEVCGLNYGDIDVNGRTVRVFGKGNKVRIVPIGSKSLTIVNEYINSKNFSSSKDPLLTRNGSRIYSRWVHRVVNKYLSKVTDIKKKSPHILRHSAATHMLDRGADLKAVKEILGHENLSTTQIYTHVSIERLKTAYKKSHPKS
ncbi:MAG TPA: tyrosine-type recombinase/integrase, partial [Ignavibacteriaceae bacterium]|nr:tyrosine-type recombinase/integrase [Ignavibacteriaceae bacterium]